MRCSRACLCPAPALRTLRAASASGLRMRGGIAVDHLTFTLGFRKVVHGNVKSLHNLVREIENPYENFGDKA